MQNQGGSNSGALFAFSIWNAVFAGLPDCSLLAFQCMRWSKQITLVLAFLVLNLVVPRFVFAPIAEDRPTLMNALVTGLFLLSCYGVYRVSRRHR
jgi:hypothetical protein